MCAKQGFDLLVDMLSAEPIIVLNTAFCQLHRKRCPASEQLLRECAYVSVSCLHALLQPQICTLTCANTPASSYSAASLTEIHEEIAKASCPAWWRIQQPSDKPCWHACRLSR